MHITFSDLPFFAWSFAATLHRLVSATRKCRSICPFVGCGNIAFACVLLHDSAFLHSQKNTNNIQSITLFLFGGVSSLEEIPRDPKTELKMALQAWCQFF